MMPVTRTPISQNDNGQWLYMLLGVGTGRCSSRLSIVAKCGSAPWVTDEVFLATVCLEKEERPKWLSCCPPCCKLLLEKLLSGSRVTRPLARTQPCDSLLTTIFKPIGSEYCGE